MHECIPFGETMFLLYVRYMKVHKSCTLQNICKILIFLDKIMRRTAQLARVDAHVLVNVFESVNFGESETAAEFSVIAQELCHEFYVKRHLIVT